ncbi:DUF350 domain-containing protein [bacterium]|nr:DUF350 domain-containing protein [bacterium]MBU1958419.1 DUF350 domain-containing protein [bacterium]
MEIFHLSGALSALIYAGLGITVFFLVLTIIEVVTKYSVNTKITQEGNVALAIVLGAIILSLGMIISAAIR